MVCVYDYIYTYIYTLASTGKSEQRRRYMERSSLPLLSSLSLFILLLCMASGCDAHSQEKKTWCVAKPSTDEATLMANLNYACSQVDCSVLQSGKPCFYPDTLFSHASVAMNLYYQANGRNFWNCYFKNTGLVTITDPSCNGCVYACQ